MNIAWSPNALARIDDIAVYIAEDNPHAAIRWVEDLFGCVERLSDHPESGRMVPEVGARRIREILFGSYRVIYRLTDRVEILTVRRSNQVLRAQELHETSASYAGMA